jgi:hypothetical protein
MAFGDIVQVKRASSPTTTLDVAPIVGNSLVWVKTCRAGSPQSPTTETWTHVRTESSGGNFPGSSPDAVYFHLVDGSDTAVFGTNVLSSGDKAWLIEVEGVLALDDDNGASSLNNVNPLTSLSPTAGLPAFLLSVAHLEEDGSSNPFTPETGMTLLAQDGSNSPKAQINYRQVATTSGSYTVGSTWSPYVYANTCVIGVAFTGLPPTPGAGFSGTPTSGAVPLSVEFTDESTNAPTSWAWDFGDGDTSTDQNPTHVYEAPGVYTVALTATNAGGGDTETKVAYVVVTIPLEGQVWT